MAEVRADFVLGIQKVEVVPVRYALNKLSEMKVRIPGDAYKLRSIRGDEHQHKCTHCRKHYSCIRNEDCAAAKMGICSSCVKRYE